MLSEFSVASTVTYATRWTAADSTAPGLPIAGSFRNYDGNHSTFGVASISATHSADANLFSVYAALSAYQTSMTLVVINKDPANAANVGFATQFHAIVSAGFHSFEFFDRSNRGVGEQTWTSVQSFAPYSVTLLVIAGKLSQTPAAEWDLNPDAIQVAASSTVTLAPKIGSSNGASVTLQSRAVRFRLCRQIAARSRSPHRNLHRAATVRSDHDRRDSRLLSFHGHRAGQRRSATKQGGWLVVGNPAASLAKTGDNQTGGVGKTLQLSVTLNPGSVRRHKFRREYSLYDGCRRPERRPRAKMVATNSSGVAAVTLTLPSSARDNPRNGRRPVRPGPSDR